MSGSFLMIADPLWSCVMLFCGPLQSFVLLCGSFAVFSHTHSLGLVWKKTKPNTTKARIHQSKKCTTTQKN